MGAEPARRTLRATPSHPGMVAGADVVASGGCGPGGGGEISSSISKSTQSRRRRSACMPADLPAAAATCVGDSPTVPPSLPVDASSIVAAPVLFSTEMPIRSQDDRQTCSSCSRQCCSRQCCSLREFSSSPTGQLPWPSLNHTPHRESRRSTDTAVPTIKLPSSPTVSGITRSHPRGSVKIYLPWRRGMEDHCTLYRPPTGLRRYFRTPRTAFSVQAELCLFLCSDLLVFAC